MKKVLITGGSRGIGKAVAATLSLEGYEVYAPGSKELDVSNPDSIDKYFEENKITELDILVNNAGLYHSDHFSKHSFEDWRKVMDINLDGVFRVCKKAAPLLVKEQSNLEHASIVNISSVSAYGEMNAIAYTTSKSALIGFTRALALDLARDNITVNAICPGWVRTDMARESMGSSKENEERALGAVLQKRWIEPEEIAGLVKYLISDEAKAITGQSINIAAGLDL